MDNERWGGSDLNRITLLNSAHDSVRVEGLEPSIAGWKPAVIATVTTPAHRCGRWESNPPHPSWQPGLAPLPRPQISGSARLVRGGVEAHRFDARGWCTAPSVGRPGGRSKWDSRESNPAHRFKRPVHHRQCLRPLVELITVILSDLAVEELADGCGLVGHSPMVVSLGVEPRPSGFQPDAQTSYARKRWSGRRDSNPQHSVSETDVPPIELLPRMGPIRRALCRRRDYSVVRGWERVELNHQVFSTRLVYSQLASPVAALSETTKGESVIPARPLEVLSRLSPAQSWSRASVGALAWFMVVGYEP